MELIPKNTQLEDLIGRITGSNEIENSAQKIIVRVSLGEATFDEAKLFRNLVQEDMAAKKPESKEELERWRILMYEFREMGGFISGVGTGITLARKKLGELKDEIK